jgi:TnpA family transposase
MPETLQYITNEQGDRIGVVLDLDTYSRLTPALDPEYLIGLTTEELKALASCKLALTDQNHLDQLIDRNTENSLSEGELDDLDDLLEKVDHLTILKTRARYTLRLLQTRSEQRIVA